MNAAVCFYSPHEGMPFGVRAWARLMRPRFIHTTLVLWGPGGGMILWDQPYAAPGGWYEANSHLETRRPKSFITLDVSGGVEDVERVSLEVQDWETDRIGSAMSVLLGYPRRPRNCTTSVCRILTELGYPIHAVTPDQLWSEMNARQGLGRTYSGVCLP